MGGGRSLRSGRTFARVRYVPGSLLADTSPIPASGPRSQDPLHVGMEWNGTKADEGSLELFANKLITGGGNDVINEQRTPWGTHVGVSRP